MINGKRTRKNMNPNPKIDIAKWHDTRYYATATPTASGEQNVELHKKEEAGVKHGVLIGVGLFAALAIACYKLDERFS